MQEDRNELVVERFERGIGIDIDNLDAGAELRRERREGRLHLMAEVAVGA
jgi:hypothetical protein